MGGALQVPPAHPAPPKSGPGPIYLQRAKKLQSDTLLCRILWNSDVALFGSSSATCRSTEAESPLEGESVACRDSSAASQLARCYYKRTLDLAPVLTNLILSDILLLTAKESFP
ncbi:hypothetical protein BASA61_006333 [Batrachochytrium salamandrivorans]|nr:hypothetical protein BASA61_006333 [Batrachochytrium salamandrivorans]